MAENTFPELREFIKENDQKLHDFCNYMMYGAGSVEEVLTQIFRDFGDYYRKATHGGKIGLDGEKLRTELYRLAWRRLREELAGEEYGWMAGRDTRGHRVYDEDLLATWKKGKQGEAFFDAAMERLAVVDTDFRAPIVLRDVLGIPDDEAVKILELRWGVYRHRLHRGRLEYMESLKGRLSGAASPS